MSIKISLTIIIVMIIDMTTPQLTSVMSTTEEPRTFTKMAAELNLATIEHDVVTDDGYILKVFHIPGEKTRPVLLSHGVFGTGDIFITRGNTSLAYILAMEGYDVWALNLRGTRYSRRHINLDPDKDKEFWNFSIHEHGYYDLASSIDYILNSTGQQQLSTIGISEGTTITFVLGATRPEYNDKLKIFMALAPIGYLHNVGLPTSITVAFSDVINELLMYFGIEELIGYKSFVRAIYKVVCKQKIGYDLCLRIGLFTITGADAEELEPEFFKQTIDLFPDGTSRKNMAHYAQIAKRKVFAQYDYKNRNFAIYGTKSPPEYNLDNVKMDVVLICGKNDKLSTLKDVEIVRRRLPNVVAYKVLSPPNFNHVDHVWGRNVHKISFPFILEMLNRYNEIVPTIY